MSEFVAAELSATCSALGYFDEKSNTYYADRNVLEAVKDLVRYLRKDGETHEIRRQLGETNVVQTDLLPLLKSCWEDNELFDVLLRLLVNLTTSPLILWHDEPPTDKIARNFYLEIEGHLLGYKFAFTDSKVWAILSTKLSKILELDYAERGDENGVLIERILVLIRNVLYVHADENRPDNDANTHDKVLWSLHQSGMVDIILYMSGSTAERVYYMHILEILSFMFREQNPSELAKSALERNETEKLKDEAQLLAFRHQETNERRRKARLYNSARHSRFGGTYVVKSMNSISEKDLIYHKPLNRLDQLSFDAEKQKPKKPKNRVPLKEFSYERHSAFSVRLFLKEFCIEFSNGAYNTIMNQVKENLQRARAQAHDESYYLWAMRFFMEFNRCYNFEVKLVSETTSMQSFHFVQKQLETYFDMLSTDKKKSTLWSRRLHLAILAYRELLLTVSAMDASSDETIRRASKVIKSNVFYVLEYRELVLTLLVTYDELKMSQMYLNDLLETQHVFIRMLERFCKNSGTIVVEDKRKKRKKGRRGKQQQTAVESGEKVCWDEIATQVSAVLENPAMLSGDVMPFDAASSVPVEEQKADALKTIQRKLKEYAMEEAVALFRASREVWPENDIFGNATTSPDEEYLLLQEIFHAELGNEPDRPPAPTEDTHYEDDEEDEIPDASETAFKFEDFAKRLANPRVIRACALSLRTFAQNSPHTNHCVVKLLHRIAFDDKMYVLLFQASIFRTFQRVYELKAVPQHKELVKFATYVLRRFFKVTQTNAKVFMELLFWKGPRDAFEIEHGYGTTDTAGAKTWSELEEDELRRLVVEHQQKGVDEDVVNWVRDNLIKHNRTRRSVLIKLKEMHLLTDYKGIKKNNKKNAPWTLEEENELQELYQQFETDDDPLGSIMNNLRQPRPKNRIIEKLLVMGLISDRTQLKKKRSKVNSHRQQSTTNDSSDDDLPQQQQKPRKRKPKPKPKPPRRQPTVVSSHELRQLITAVVQKNTHREPLEWLKESFEEAADDLQGAQNLEDVAIPLVPFTEMSEQALDEKEFQGLLKGFGVLEADGEQEVYWRIPGSLSADTLRSHCALIEGVLDGTLEALEKDGGGSDADEGRRQHISNLESSSSANEDETEVGNNPGKKNRKVFSLDEEENGVGEQVEASQESMEKKLLSSDEEFDGNQEAELRVSGSEEVEMLVDNVGQSNFHDQMVLNNASDEELKRNRSDSNSETDQPKKKTKRIVSSDEE